MKAKQILITFFLSIIASNAFSYDIMVSNDDNIPIGYNFINDGKELEVTYLTEQEYSNSTYDAKYSHDYSGNIIIPQEVDYEGKTYKVTSIGPNAFRSCIDLISVTIPQSVSVIKEYAFSYCDFLETAYIPNNITSIGDNAFENCVTLTSLTLPKELKEIGAFAFRGCLMVPSITLPSGLISIGEWAFAVCLSLESIICEIEFPIDLPYNVFTCTNNEIYSDAILTVPSGKKTRYMNSVSWSSFQNIVEAGGGSDDSSFIVNDIAYDINGAGTVEVSSAYMLINYASLPDIVSYKGGNYSVTAIGEKAFYKCSNLEAILIPNSVSSIGEGAFYGCSLLQTITIPNGVSSIGIQAFSDCNSLTVIHSNIQDPFIINENTFTDDIYNNALLFVPKGTKALYQSTQGWSNFININEEGGGEDSFKLKLVAEKDWTGCSEGDLLAYEIGNGFDASIHASEEGIVISLPEMSTYEDYPHTMILDGFNLEQGKAYLVRITAKIPSKGQLCTRMGRYYYNAIPGSSTVVEANDEFQEIDFYFPDYNSSTDGDAQIILDSGFLVGTTIIKKVQLFETITTTVLGVIAEKDDIMGIYDLHGIRKKVLSKGLNVIITKGGTTKKIYLK